MRPCDRLRNNDEMRNSMTKELSLTARVWEAFHQELAPVAPESFLNHRQSEQFEETKSFWGKDWSELTVEMFEQSRIFSFLPESSAFYFLGCFMWLVLNKQQFVEGSDSLLYLIEPVVYKKNVISPRLEKWYGLMDHEQQKATVEFLLEYAKNLDEFGRGEIQVFLDRLGNIRTNHH
jgi:hypothetical protein